MWLYPGVAIPERYSMENYQRFQGGDVKEKTGVVLQKTWLVWSFIITRRGLIDKHRHQSLFQNRPSKASRSGAGDRRGQLVIFVVPKHAWLHTCSTNSGICLPLLYLVVLVALHIWFMKQGHWRKSSSELLSYYRKALPLVLDVWVKALSSINWVKCPFLVDQRQRAAWLILVLCQWYFNLVAWCAHSP